MKHKDTWFGFMLGALMPVPVMAFNSGVVGMAEAEKFEQQHQTVATWAFEKLVSLETGFRQMLEPIYPQPQGFNLLDAQIQDIVIQGQLEETRLLEIIEQIETRLEAPSEPISFVATEVSTEPQQSVTAQSEASEVVNTVPEIDVMAEDGTLLAIDTSGGIDLPNLTIDPRDGGTYESEIAPVDDALDIVQQLQDQVPSPIQSKANDIYNGLTGTDKPDELT